MKNFVQKNKCFGIVGQIIICKMCTKSFTYVPKHGVNPLKQHMLTKGHKRNEKSPYLRKELLKYLKPFLEDYCEFDVSLLEALTAAQPPLHKLENPVFKDFLEKYTKCL
jgi:hypothetical protein